MYIQIYAFLVGLYSIFPKYIEIFSINVSNIIATFVFLFTFFINGKLIKSNIKKAILSLAPFWLNIIYRFLAYAFVGNYIESIMQMISTFMFCISLCIAVKNKRIFHKLLDSLINFAGVLCIYGIIECLTQNNFFNAFRNDPYIEIRNGIYRISTTFDHPIVYANYLGLILMVLAFKLCNSESRRKKLKYYFIYGLVYVNLFLTVSRSAIIIVTLFQLILFHTLEQRKGNMANLCKYVIFPFIGIFSFISLLFGDQNTSSSSVFQVFIDLFNGGFTSVVALGDRFSLFEWVWEATKGNPIFGNGINALFEYQYSYYYVKNSIEVEYLYTFFRFGFIGVLVQVLSFVSVLKLTRSNRNRLIRKRDDFNYFMYLMFLSYFVVLFAVTQQTELRTYFILVCLCYNYSKFMNGGKIVN
ncbi:MAG: hypothetical protein K0S41_2707 [Anaerocolumna sp.]|jgi:hypothetical protein|nr:hypothetical protein [Anaerocolumna sp.]